MTHRTLPAAPGTRPLAPSLSPPAEKRRRLPVSVDTVVSYLIIFIVVALYVFPLLYLLNISLKTPIGFILDPTGVTKTWHWQNYGDAWSRGGFGSALVNSALYTVVSSFLSTLFSLLLAFPIARGYVRWSRFWYALFVVALFLPNALIPQFQLILRLGLYDTQLGYILLQSALLGVGPFLIVGYLRSIPKELDEAAAIDGCGYFRFLGTIIAPLIIPVLVTTFLLHAITVWNDIIGPTIYLADQQYYPVTLGLFSFYGQYGNQWTTLSAATLIVAVPLILLYLFLQRYFIAGALGGALKS